jgi:hypothetical protein
VGQQGAPVGVGRADDVPKVEPGPIEALGGREVFLYVIGGHKVRNPGAATALLERLGKRAR